jgi:hypothetical protein
MKKLLKIIAGLLFTAGPLCLILPGMPMASWGEAALELIKGGTTIVVILIGLAIIAMGFSELKE